MREMMREAIRDLKPYHAPYVVEGIKLDANENTYPIQEALKVHMAQWVMEMPVNFYPDTDSTALREAISKVYGLSPTQVICGVGSDQLIDCILRTFVEKDDVVLAPAPSFSMYGLSTRINEGRLMEVALKEDFNYDLEAFCEAITTYDPKVIFLCNPNNPTGTLLSTEALQRIVATAKGIVVLDEAYAEFHEDCSLEVMKAYPNVIVLRTFSKAYGLAGARVGYGLASEALIQCLETVRPPYNLNIFSQEVGRFVMTHKKAFDQAIQWIKETRDEVRERLIQFGMEVAPSAANFLWIRTEEPLDTLLKDAQVHIKKFMHKDTVYYRMSMGTKEEMQQVISILEEALSKR
ncbi:MAG: histidinol-phosphate transaminase [Cellulosilyticaceae bacterium]